MKTNEWALPDNVRSLPDEMWLELLLRSTNKQDIEGIRFPGFPPPEVQARFVGSSYEHALKEAFQFYKYVKAIMAKLRKPLISNSRFLDFGCGWGRYLRFFWKDISHQNLFGCDVLPLAIDICRDTNVPGNLNVIDARGNLPYPDDFFDSIIAYSVFTHLPETMNLHWMQELARVSRPGCIFCLTLEPRRFIDFITTISPDADFGWYRALLKYAHTAQDMYRKFDVGQIAYIPTGGGDTLSDDIYGDAIVPLNYIKDHWSSEFVVHEYLDDPNLFWQAVLVVEKK